MKVNIKAQSTSNIKEMD